MAEEEIDEVLETVSELEAHEDTPVNVRESLK
jgi:hypothetical protein